MLSSTISCLAETLELWSSELTNFLPSLVPYWTQPEQLSAQKSDGWESVVDMALDIYQPNEVRGGDDRPVLVRESLMFLIIYNNMCFIPLIVGFGF